MRRLVAVVLVAAFAGHLSAQEPQLSFEEATVAGIDPSVRYYVRRRLTTTTFFDQTDLLQLIVSAYLDADGAGACALKIAFGDECAPIVGSVPAWMRTRKFEVAAKLPSKSLSAETLDRLRAFRYRNSARKDVYPLPIQLMLRRLLEETFDFAVRHQRREVPVWAITARTRESTLMHSNGSTGGVVRATRGQGYPPFGPDDLVRLAFEGSTMKDAAAFFSGYLDRPVIDRTGLDGEYDFTFAFNVGPDARWKSGPYIPLMGGFDAARLAAGLHALGFGLEAATASFDALVIESASSN